MNAALQSLKHSEQAWERGIARNETAEEMQNWLEEKKKELAEIREGIEVLEAHLNKTR